VSRVSVAATYTCSKFKMRQAVAINYNGFQF